MNYHQLFSLTFDEDIESHHPLLVIYVISRILVEIFEDPVHYNIVRDVEVFMQKLSKLLPIQLCMETL